MPRISAKSLLCKTKQDTVQDKTRYQTLVFLDSALVFLDSALQYFLCTKNVDSALGCLPTLNWLIWLENRFHNNLERARPRRIRVDIRDSCRGYFDPALHKAVSGKID